MISAAAARYARAFADVILSPGGGLEPDSALQQLRALEGVVEESSDLRHALNSPAVQNSQKRAIVARFADELGTARMTRNFLFVLIDHGRVALLPQIIESFEAEIDRRLGFARAEVTSARTLAPPQQAAIEAGLAQATGKQVRARYEVDPSLIGGVVARIGSTVYDGSIRGQLGKMRREIAQHTAAGF